MNLIEKAISVVMPVWGESRARARYKIMAYEAATPTRTHKTKRENRNANQLTQFGG